MEHTFTRIIHNVLYSEFKEDAKEIFQSSNLLLYINIKTRSAEKGSKSRGSFANLYAIYVLVEDYIAHNYHIHEGYSQYEGAIYTNLLRRQRELPFGNKLQNHALNHRVNEEFKKYFPTVDYIPIIRDLVKNRYWINENLLKINIGKIPYNLSSVIIKIIDTYIKTKKDSFETFIKTCENLQLLETKDPLEIEDFIINLLEPNVDARIFEIVSYAILKYHYYEQSIYIGFDVENLAKENLKLYKTGRTNANDGGIDFVMRPLGRFFQVTETLDIKKYFLDIDKVQRYPITFVIKSNDTPESLRAKLKENAHKQYPIDKIIERYMMSIEEIINIPSLILMLRKAVEQNHLQPILEEIIRQSKIEFNYIEESS